MVLYEVTYQYERYGTLRYHINLHINMNGTVLYGIIWSYISIWTVRYHILSYKVAHQYERYGTVPYGIIWSYISIWTIRYIKLHTNMTATVPYGIIWSYISIWTVRYHTVSYKFTPIWMERYHMVSYKDVHQYERYGTIWYHMKLYINMNDTVPYGIM